jgi:hypothetical protein
MKKTLFLAVVILFSYINSVAQCLTVNSTLQEFIDQKKDAMNSLKLDIENRIAQQMQDVYLNANGHPSYANWISFEQTAQKIEELNEEWDDLFGNSITEILQRAYILKLCTDPSQPSEAIDCAQDSLEQKYFQYPEEYASLYFEQRLSLTSYRSVMQQQDEKWLASEPSDLVNNPAMNQELDEEYWPVVNSTMKCEIRNTEIDEQQIDSYFLNDPTAVTGKTNNLLVKTNSALLNSMQLPSVLSSFWRANQNLDYFKIKWENIAKLLGKIKTVAEILVIVVGIVKTVWDQMADCAESKEIKEKNFRYNGFPTLSNDRYIGYEIEQRSVTFDGKGSTTKIKGKAKLYKYKNGKIKEHDRKGKIGIEYCTRQFDVCNKVDYPVDVNYIVPTVGPKEKAKKAKISKLDCMIPFALAPTKSIHFLSFSFFYNSSYQKTVPLLAIGTPVLTRCR